MTNTHAVIAQKLKALRVDRAKGVAPHKPLLLLVVLELAESGMLPTRDLQLTPDLAFRFSVYWSIVAHRRSQPPDIRLPFHHLRSSKLWITIKPDGSDSTHRDTTTSIRLSAEFFNALQSPDFRYLAGQILISNYFEHAEQVALYELAGIEAPTDLPLMDKIGMDADEVSGSTGRTARFRVDVVAAYCHTCALTGYRITTVTGHSIVDAAHIHQFASSRNDNPQNGIALCKNAHWLFDIGLWSVDSEYRVIVANDAFSEDCPTQESLKSMAGRTLRLPVDESLWPSNKNLEWHRTKRFVG